MYIYSIFIYNNQQIYGTCYVLIVKYFEQIINLSDFTCFCFYCLASSTIHSIIHDRIQKYILQLCAYKLSNNFQNTYLRSNKNGIKKFKAITIK